MKNVLYIIEIDQETLTTTRANYFSFAFIDKYSFYQKEKEILFLNDSVFGIQNIRYVKSERKNDSENSVNNQNDHYEITMNLISMGINKFDHLKFSESELLDVSNRNFPEYEMQIIDEIIKYNSFAKIIYLQNNHIGVSSELENDTSLNNNINSLTKNLIINSNLIGLNLAQNNLGSIGAKLICEVIVNNKRIKWLNISSNDIGDEGAYHIGDTLRTNESLKWLELNDNKICAYGVKKIAESLIINKCLKKLEIGNNNSTDIGIISLAQMIDINNSLDWLDVSSNKITIVGVKMLFKALSENKVLKYVNLWDNNATYKEINRIDKLNLIDKEIDY